MGWSANQYVRFENERTRPVRDLLSAVETPSVRRAADLGCGPGNSTQVLLERYPAAKVVGVDSSADMLAAARARLPRCEFQQADLARWQPDHPCDVVLANASLHWVPDHQALFPHLMRGLAPGGCLAVQMPTTNDEPAHVLMREVASSGPWAEKLAPVARARFPQHAVDWYYRLLQPISRKVDIWHTRYHHVLAGGAPAIAEWFKGSGLRPFLEVLGSDERSIYLSRYVEALEAAYPRQPDGSVLLPFPRLFIVAAR